MVDVDVLQVIQPLQHIVGRIVEHAGPLMAADPLEEHLIGDAVMQVFAGVDLEADVDADILRMVEDRFPALCQFVEGCLDQAGGALRPWVDIRPGQRPRKGRDGRQAKVCRGGQRLAELVHRPLLTRLRPAAHGLRGKPVEQKIIGRMHGNELALQMGGQFGENRTVCAQPPGQLLRVIARGGRKADIHQAHVARRHLQADIAAIGCPPGEPVERVEGGLVPDELSQEQAGALHRLHLQPPCSEPD